ncbi:Peptidase M12A [Trinorchestia longiramus]|nr:Peptidase M12A [Trinorchestia longiramus]
MVQSFDEAPAHDLELEADLDLNLGLPGEEAGLDTLEVNSSFTGSFQPVIRKGTPSSANLWPKSNGYPTIAYRVADTQVPSSVIMQAITHFEERTCVRFESTFWPLPGRKITFRDGSECSSAVGLQSNLWWWLKGQPITLGSGCDRISTVVHEIGHALGMFHEQSRSDRDDHVTIVYKNVKSGVEDNFNKLSSKNFNTEYDFFSVLHYGPFAFSSNGRATVVPKDPMAKGLMLRNRAGLSHMDAMLVNKLYGCIDLWVSKCLDVSEDPCENLGYFGPDCKCVCPDGSSGKFCENKSQSYTQALIAKYLPKNEKFTTPATISSDATKPDQQPLFLSFDHRKKLFTLLDRAGDIFTKLFTAPSCQRPYLTVEKFDLAPKSSSGRCSFQGTEIGLEGPASSGVVYCGTQLQVGQTLKSSSTSLFVFYWHATKTAQSATKHTAASDRNSSRPRSSRNESSFPSSPEMKKLARPGCRLPLRRRFINWTTSWKEGRILCGSVTQESLSSFVLKRNTQAA